MRPKFGIAHKRTGHTPFPLIIPARRALLIKTQVKGRVEPGSLLHFFSLFSLLSPYPATLYRESPLDDDTILVFCRRSSSLLRKSPRAHQSRPTHHTSAANQRHPLSGTFCLYAALPAPQNWQGSHSKSVGPTRTLRRPALPWRNRKRLGGNSAVGEEVARKSGCCSRKDACEHFSPSLVFQTGVGDISDPSYTTDDLERGWRSSAELSVYITLQRGFD